MKNASKGGGGIDSFPAANYYPTLFPTYIRDPLEYVRNNTTTTATVVAMKKVLKTL